MSLTKFDFKNVEDLQITSGDVVYFRPDFNVMQKDGEIKDTARIDQSIPSIQIILSKGGVPVIISHAEEKQGEEKNHPSMNEVAMYLEQQLNKMKENSKVNVILVRVIEEIQQQLQKVNAGSTIILVENIRKIEKDETSEKEQERIDLAKRLKNAINSKFAVFDAFSVAHRRHMSIREGMMMVKPECRAIGNAACIELNALLKINNKPLQHQLQIIGGAKLGDKINLIRKMLESIDKVARISEEKAIGLAVVGALSTNFIIAKYNLDKKQVGTSLISEKDIEEARKLLKRFESLILVPVDVRIAPVSDIDDFEKIDEYEGDLPIVDLDKGQIIPEDWAAVDIGPGSEQAIKEKFVELKARGMQGSVVWNGPAGVDVQNKASKGTMTIVQAIDAYAKEGGTTYVGGGDSYKSLKLIANRTNQNANELICRVNASTAGGASLAGLGAENPREELPGIAVLYEQRIIE